MSLVARDEYLRELLLVGIFLFGIFGILASGGGGGGGGGSSIVSISDLDYSPEGAFLNDGGGSVIVNGSIDFSAPDGNVASYVLTVFDSSLNVVSTLSDPIPGVSGLTSGSLFVSLVINTTAADDYSVEVYLIDTSNNNSNTLAGTFQILAPIQTSSNIPDTGVDKCYNQGNIINCPIVESDPFYGQDYQYSSNPMNFTNNGDGTVTDNVTSLIWQMDQDGLEYNWYEATGTFDATNNPATTDVCGDLTLAGHTDWRLPGKRELESIVDYGLVNPAIDATFFPNTGIFNYWINLEYNSTQAWYGKFEDGSTLNADKATDMHLRCVRGTIWGNSTYVDNGDGTVTDTESALMWRKDANNTSNDWDEMLAFCEGLNYAGYTNWRLADIKELESLVDADFFSPIVISSGLYCSSSTIVDVNESVWTMTLTGQAGLNGHGRVLQWAFGNTKVACSSVLFRCVR